MKPVGKTLLFWGLVLLLLSVPRLTNLNVFYARDELTIWSWSDQFTQAIWQGNLAGTLTRSDYPGIPMFWAQTIFLTFKAQFPALFPETTLPPDQLVTGRSLAFLAERRAVAGLFGTLQLLCLVGLLQWHLGRKVALLAAIFLGLDPFTLTEARLFRLESISANFVILSLVTFYLFNHTQRPAWLVLSGFMAGLAVSSKTSAGLLLPVMMLLWLWQARQSQAWFGVITEAVKWGLSAMLGFILIWPAMGLYPITALQHLLIRGVSQVSEESVWHGDVFFWGQLFDQDPGPFFYPVALAFRTTPLMWLGLALTIRPLRANTPLITTLWLFTLVVGLELTVLISKVDRFLILIFPALSLLSALGWAKVLHRYSPVAVTGLLLVVQLGFTLPAHPHYFTYWNPLLGGGRVAMKTLPLGSGEGVSEAMAYLNEQPQASQKILVCGTSQPWCERVFQGTTWRAATYTDGAWFGADYASLYVSQLQRQLYPREVVNFLSAQPPLYQVDLLGATYMQVYAVPKADYVAPPQTDLTGLGRLLGYSLNSQTIRRGETLTMTVWWVNYGAGEDALRVHWRDNQGYVWGQTRASAEAPPAEVPAIIVSHLQLPIPAETPPGEYELQFGFQQSPLNFALSPDMSRLTVVNPFTLPTTLTLGQQSVQQSLSPALDLLGYDLPTQPLNPQSPTWLAFYWQAVAVPSNELIHLMLFNQTNELVATWQGLPTQGQYPPAQWQIHEVVKDVWPLQLKTPLPGGTYYLAVKVGQGEVSYRLPLEVWSQPLSYDLPTMQVTQPTEFDPRLKLLGYDLFIDVTGQQQQLAPVFYWQSQQEFNQSFELQLSLLSTDNIPLQTWRVPLADSKTTWKPREIVTTPYHFSVQLTPNTPYHLTLTLLEAGHERHTLRLENIQTQAAVRVK